MYIFNYAVEVARFTTCYKKIQKEQSITYFLIGKQEKIESARPSETFPFLYLSGVLF